MHKDSFFIRGLGGERALHGEIAVGGAKNAALPLMAALPLFENQVALQNVPAIEDVARMSELMKALGADISFEGGRMTLRGDSFGTQFDRTLSKRMRASIILTGPILSASGAVRFPHPGGCVIGKRPIDLFLESFVKMGAEIFEDGEYYVVKARNKRLCAAEIFFRVQSVTATETLMLAAVLAEGKTTLKNAAMEPEIISLADFLIASGAKIKGAGTPVIEITGAGKLNFSGSPWSVIPDRIETGSFLFLGALAGKDLKITNCNPTHLEIVIDELRRSGVAIEIGESSLKVFGAEKGVSRSFKPFDIKTHEYPGFPTDLQAPATVFLTQAAGEAQVFESIFEGRLHYVEDLVRMGAEIEMMDTHRVRIKGPAKLRGRELEGPDIRAGLAYVIAAIIAEGESAISNVYFIDRGYERVEERLRKIGADIIRTTN
ncbi:MAG: UDP-N-acetylglucosamine 1-carboxyvinyltransferase [Parcubacteria group bacterium GW2011_GWA2_47_21]|nr:MAG: UDP-N-acetylglucosamine 1-carboxyvinyltransferase [Parcubacteria group bacterium GW2011_GWA2_47_21]